MTHHELSRRYTVKPVDCQSPVTFLGTYLEVDKWWYGLPRHSLLIKVHVCVACDLVIETARVVRDDPKSLALVHTYHYSEALKPRRSV